MRDSKTNLKFVHCCNSSCSRTVSQAAVPMVVDKAIAGVGELQAEAGQAGGGAGVGSNSSGGCCL
jgi:hypothetical protein